MAKKVATIKDISLSCGVSVSTVSKALNGYQDISEATREMIIKAAREAGYFPEANVRALKMKKTYNIGVLFSTLSKHGLRNEYFAHILASFKEKAAKRGYDITFIEHNIGNRKMTYLDHCRLRNFDGVFIACAEFTEPEVLELVNSDYPVVTIDHAFNEAISVLSDNVEGMRQLTQYIIDQGHRKIAYIHGTKSSVTHNRLVSFHNVLKENGITVPEEYFAQGIYRSAESSEKLALHLLNLKDPPTCIIASDDYAALGVMNTARRMGLKIPEDISVAGYDGISVAQALEPKLTTIKQDTDKIGFEAARQLINLIENPMSTSLDTIYLKVQLVKGGSVRNLR
ncbi:LacI family DNA-binding transcriptional regulator [Anaerocolumna sp. MB42-C2]|uniref:LacI family DNA-binding transcriptional regulator n=1 Tax=Anaerocolumna sp. MB42-C2 TaxID=3070997 RepID=UPI0027DFC1B5|nr:LacI family DNA-binding transcriptional regulator [Anaerocolumna sp. MB42-C2]WMJ85731.1 LacI family DNA-binding transcriptional regulator [Anaerocolumna sp. MB42-C2]